MHYEVKNGNDNILLLTPKYEDSIPLKTMLPPGQNENSSPLQKIPARVNLDTSFHLDNQNNISQISPL